jgi:hypothetical protein
MRPVAGMFAVASALMMTSLAVGGGRDEGRCALPAADSREGATPPTLDGTIADLRKDCFRVRSSRHRATPPICLTRETKLFTVYGGAVSVDELREGQRVHVWLQGCRPPDGARPSPVAVVEVASLRPGEDFP